MSDEIDLRQLQGTLTSAVGLIFEVLISTGTVQADVLAQALGTLRDAALQKGQPQTAGDLELLRLSLTKREADREALQSLLKGPPGGSA